MDENRKEPEKYEYVVFICTEIINCTIKNTPVEQNGTLINRTTIYVIECFQSIQNTMIDPVIV